jgi:predicted nucleotidyltransferase
MSVELLEAAAEFGDLLERVVFLGGATIGLWITDPTARAPRVTYDVDVVAEVVTLGAYEAFQTDLRRQGFREDVDSGVMSRWRAGDGDLIVDVVPADPRLAGFGGVWLERAAEASVDRELPSRRVIRVVPPAHLVATKLEAFADRGDSDPLASKDFEDLALLVDGRHELLGEVAEAPEELRRFIADAIRDLIALRDFEYGVEGALLGADASARATQVTIPRFEDIARL